jgi:hypothetical protein
MHGHLEGVGQHRVDDDDSHDGDSHDDDRNDDDRNDDDRNDDIFGQIVARVCEMGADRSDLVQLFDCEVDRPRISPDGARIVFSLVMNDATKQIAMTRIDGCWAMRTPSMWRHPSHLTASRSCSIAPIRRTSISSCS